MSAAVSCLPLRNGPGTLSMIKVSDIQWRENGIVANMNFDEISKAIQGLPAAFKEEEEENKRNADICEEFQKLNIQVEGESKLKPVEDDESESKAKSPEENDESESKAPEENDESEELVKDEQETKNATEDEVKVPDEKTDDMNSRGPVTVTTHGTNAFNPYNKPAKLTNFAAVSQHWTTDRERISRRHLSGGEVSDFSGNQSPLRYLNSPPLTPSPRSFTSPHSPPYPIRNSDVMMYEDAVKLQPSPASSHFSEPEYLLSPESQVVPLTPSSSSELNPESPELPTVENSYDNASLFDSITNNIPTDVLDFLVDNEIKLDEIQSEYVNPYLQKLVRDVGPYNGFQQVPEEDTFIPETVAEFFNQYSSPISPDNREVPAKASSTSPNCSALQQDTMPGYSRAGSVSPARDNQTTMTGLMASNPMPIYTSPSRNSVSPFYSDDSNEGGRQNKLHYMGSTQLASPSSSIMSTSPSRMSPPVYTTLKTPPIETPRLENVIISQSSPIPINIQLPADKNQPILATSPIGSTSIVFYVPVSQVPTRPAVSSGGKTVKPILPKPPEQAKNPASWVPKPVTELAGTAEIKVETAKDRFVKLLDPDRQKEKFCQVFSAKDAVVFSQDQNTGNSKLHIAICQRDKELTYGLIERFKNKCINLTNNNGQTPLFNAAATNQVELLDYILESGGEPNIPNRIGTTALHQVSEHGLHDAVRVLTKNAKTNINANNCKGESPLHGAVIFNGCRQTYGEKIFVRNNLPVIKLLVDAGVSLATKEITRRQTVLHVAAAKQDLESLQILCSSPTLHLAINEVNSDGLTALDLAMKAADSERKDRIVDLLVSKGGERVTDLSDLLTDLPDIFR